MRLLYIFSLFILISSCATILNRPTKTVTIQLNKPRSIVVNKRDTLPNNLEFKYKTYRGRDTLHISILDSTNKSFYNYNIYPEFSSTLGANFFLGYGLFSLLDVKNDKGYTYPDYINLNINDTSYYKIKNSIVYSRGWFPKIEKAVIKYRTFQQTYPKDIFLKFGTTIFSENTSTNLLNETDNYFSFLDFTLGMDYYYTKRRFISLNLFQSNFSLNNLDIYYYDYTIAPNTFIKSIIPYMYSNQLVYSITSQCNLQHRHQLQKIILGYGVSISYNQHIRAIEYLLTNNLADIKRVIQKDLRIAIGPSFSAYYLVSKHLNFGFTYNPIITNLNYSSKTYSENLFSLNLDYRFKINRIPKFISSEIQDKKR